MASSYYDLQSWQAPQRQASYDQAPPSRSGASSVTSKEEVIPFGPQFEEVERAIDNLAKSGKLLGGVNSYGLAGRQYGGDYDHRQGSRPQSMDFDPRNQHGSNNLQSYYGNARYPPRNQEGGDQMQQAKRRMAAARERELRNYHQEQQYNRSISSQGKSDRSASPNTMNEEDRRELLVRQHKALYGDHAFQSHGFGENDQTPRPPPLTMLQGGESQDPRSGVDSATTLATSNNFGNFEQTTIQQSSRTSASPTGTTPPNSVKPVGAPGPIGTRPAQAMNPALIKRTTPPVGSPLSFGLGENNQAERAGSAASNPQPNGRDSMTSSGNWGTGSGVWGKGSLSGVSSTVWG